MSILTPDEIQECMTTAREVMGEGRDLEGCLAAEIEAALLKELSTNKIKTWDERLTSWPENCDIMDAMQAEIDGLRGALAYEEQEVKGWKKALYNSVLKCSLLEDKVDKLKAQLQELNLQYVSDFGQLQEKVEGLFSEYDMQNSSFAADARCIFERSTT